MANLYFYLDMRQARSNGAGSLKLAISHNRKTAYETMDIYIRPDEWDGNQVVKRPDRKFLNVIIKKRMAECTLALQRLMLRDDFAEFDSRRILKTVLRGTDTADSPDRADYVLPVYNEYITLAKKASTAETYRASLNNLKEYAGDIDTLRFKDISVAWLRKYQQWLEEERGMSVNGANVYLRNLRCVFNFALNNQYTVARYPFRDIDMGTAEPDKRVVPYEKFLEWATYPVEDQRSYYRELFLLSFYLCGIRPVDLLHVKRSQVVDGRLEYCPMKLNGRTKISVKIEPEAWEIIRRHEGKEYLLDIMERLGDYKSFMQRWNKAIKAIGRDELYYKEVSRNRSYACVRHDSVVPFISVYYSRSCWASYAYNVLDTPMDIISQALGHKSGLRVTNFYVKRDGSKVDQANRALIDRVKADMEEYRKKRVEA